MSATIHQLTEAKQAGDQPSYWQFIHEVAITNLRAKYAKQAAIKFAQFVIDESIASGNSYLAASAFAFIEELEKSK